MPSALPVLGVSIDFANGPAFGNPLILNDPSTPLGQGILADIPADVVDVSDIALKVSIRRGRNRILDKFEAGTATIVLNDSNGDWNPSNPAGAYYGKLVPLRKIRVWATYDDGGGEVKYFVYSGYITSYDTNFALGFSETAQVTLTCVDGFRLLNKIAITTVPAAGAGQYSGQRVNALLNVANWPNSQRDVEVGNSQMQADPGTVRDLLSSIQTVENSEFGAFFIDPSGNATFYSRDTVSKNADSTPVIFSDDGTEISYQSIDFAYDDTLIVNDVTVTALGGVPQNRQDPASILTYFIHSGKRDGILVQTDAEAGDQAAMLLTARQDTDLRIDSMSLSLTNPAEVAKISAGLTLDLFDLVNITKTVPGGSLVTRELFVQGVQHDITSKGVWNTKILTAEPIIQAFILDSTIQGKLEAGAGVLSY